MYGAAAGTRSVQPSILLGKAAYGGAAAPYFATES